MTKRLLLALLPISLMLGASWTPESIIRVKSMGEAMPSPDGKWLAYTLTEPVMDKDTSEPRTQIWLARVDGARRFQLTRGDKSSTAPEFSPDSQFVFFRSSREGKPNLWRIAVSGGEAQQLTDWKGEISSAHISPDGKWIAFTAWEEDPDIEAARKEKRDFRVIDEKPKLHGLWLVSTEPKPDGKGETKRLFANTYHIAEFDWAPDSRRIVFEHWPGPEPEESFRADISEVDRESGKVTPLASLPNAESSPRYAPDGRSIAYMRGGETAKWAGECRFVLLTTEDGKSRELPVTKDECGRGTNLLGFSPDSKTVIYTETDHTRNVVRAMPVDGPPRDLYIPSSGTLSSYGGSARRSLKGSSIGLVWESASTPQEAWVLAVPSGKAARVAPSNEGLPKVTETKVIRWKSKDGTDVEGVLTYPSEYRAGTRYPLMLVIHGGPMGVFTETYRGTPGLYPYACFAEKGYAILQPNPRGSSGYGRKFRFANYDDWGGGDFNDILAGVDHVVKMGVADEDRMAVMGWSYGGFMTAWTVTHTSRFKAAVVGAGVTNLWSFTGTADIPGFLPDYFAGEPWENFESYRAHSPMSFVKGVKTPTLILHGEADDRVPISQGYEFYNALKRQGVKSKMVVYPRQKHGPTEPKFVMDIMQRHLDWVESYVK